MTIFRNRARTLLVHLRFRVCVCVCSASSNLWHDAERFYTLRYIPLRKTRKRRRIFPLRASPRATLFIFRCALTLPFAYARINTRLSLPRGISTKRSVSRHSSGIINRPLIVQELPCATKRVSKMLRTTRRSHELKKNSFFFF